MGGFRRLYGHGTGTVLLMAGLLAGLLAASRTAAPQVTPSGSRVVKGSVVDVDGRVVTGARVQLLGGTAAAESDDRGLFALGGVPHGDARLFVRRVGFAPETLAVPAGGTGVQLDLVALRRIGVPLAPVIVNGRRDLRGPMAGFYARLDRGNGRFFTAEQIERTNIRRMSDLLRRVPGMRIDQRRFGTSSFRMRGSSAAPLVWLDGVPMGSSEVDLDNFDPRTFAGIEVYSGAATVPIEFSGNRAMSTSGGSILLWSRQGEASARRRKKDDPTASAVILGLLDRELAFTRDEVDQVAIPLDTALSPPLYPDSLYRGRIPGRVEVEFVVDAAGRPRMDTFGAVATTHLSLVEAVRRVIGERRYRPATRQGVAVAQLIQLPFEFVPDAALPERKPDDR